MSLAFFQRHLQENLQAEAFLTHNYAFGSNIPSLDLSSDVPALEFGLFQNLLLGDR